MVQTHKHPEKTIACAFCCINLEQLIQSGKLPCKIQLKKTLDLIDLRNKQTKTILKKTPKNHYRATNSLEYISESLTLCCFISLSSLSIRNCGVQTDHTQKLLKNIKWAFARQTYYSYSMILCFVLFFVILFIALYITNRFFKSDILSTDYFGLR